MWISLIMICHHVHAMVITINTTSGTNSTECCIDGKNCSCSSLSTALLYMTNNTVINITSESVTLEDNIKMGSGDLNNITITGNGATITCNNSGGVYCESCDNVVIEGITWDRCGDPNGTNIAGVTFNITSNISLLNCVFQYSQLWGVSFLEVSAYVNIERNTFLYNSRTVAWNNHCGGLDIKTANGMQLNLTVSKSYFVTNGHFCNYNNEVGGGLNVFSSYSSSISIFIAETQFLSNIGAAFFQSTSVYSQIIHLVDISVFNNTAASSTDVAGILFRGTAEPNHVVISSSRFRDNVGCALCWYSSGIFISILVIDSLFDNNTPLNVNKTGKCTIELYPVIMTYAGGSNTITFVDVQISNCISPNSPFGIGGSVCIEPNSPGIVNLTRVILQANTYEGNNGGTVYVYTNSILRLILNHCYINSSSAQSRGVALYIGSYQSSSLSDIHVLIFNSTFAYSASTDSVVYAESSSINVSSSNFTDNIGCSMHLSSCYLVLCETVVFKNNKADNGAALYLEESTIHIDDGSNVQFINNSAAEYGGAIFIGLERLCSNSGFLYNHNSFVAFTNNIAVISGNAIYFNVPATCEIETNVSDPSSLLYLPCQFNYSQSIHSTKYHNCSMLNDTGFPIVTSPHELRLYFNDMSSNSDHNIYFIKSNILGHEVKFNGATFDYFGKPAGSTQFNVDCANCFHISIVEKHVLVDNITSLHLTFVGARIPNKGLNVTVDISSTLLSFKIITTTIIVELIPCIDYPGNVYSEKNNMCICYYHNIDCTGDNNAIRRSYWFGSIIVRGDSNPFATTSLCPNHYCKFVGRKETTQGYFELPKTVNGQCNDHRLGRACGECGPGYTLAYDSTDCISVDHCSTGMTVLVVVLTCLYWIVVVVGVFSLMYFNFQISSGYVYGIIYYYSMVGILLDNNPYISYSASQFVSILSSFAQLSPQFLGKLCFVTGLSGIDQLFIHYSHAVAVSILTLVIVLAARCSMRITVLVSRCIIRVICLLLLLSYTSLTSTSLQLLRPLKFTDVNEVYTYASPHIEYFHRRHVIYGIVAVICELVVGIGLPLLLLLEPLLSRKINFIKIKPLLDQFRGCYKDKYRWFAAYYLICRQVIMLIVFIGNSNYYNMLFYLQTALVAIAMIHMWAQPYRNESLNALDGLILLVMVLVVNINTFPFLHSVTTEISLTLFILPLLLFCSVIIRKTMHSYIAKKKSRHHYIPIGNDNRVADENAVNQ